MRQDISFIRLQEGIEPFCPVGHVHPFVALRLIFDLIKVHGDAVGHTVSDIASCENQIHPFVHHRKIGRLLKRSPLRHF
ncbi:MAG TPA: hypothetical protein PK425_11485 [Syntrophales bacterium]|nr:hypothetical protein [Syntrophales bacterium]